MVGNKFKRKSFFLNLRPLCFQRSKTHILSCNLYACVTFFQFGPSIIAQDERDSGHILQLRHKVAVCTFKNRIQWWGSALEDCRYTLWRWPWSHALSPEGFTDIRGLQTSKSLSFHCTWKRAEALLCLPKCCFVCGWVHTPNCRPSVDTSHHLRCLQVSKRWPGCDQIRRKEIYNVNKGSCQWILAFCYKGNHYVPSVLIWGVKYVIIGNLLCTCPSVWHL